MEIIVNVRQANPVEHSVATEMQGVKEKCFQTNGYLNIPTV
jgi:hypothetical protein